MMLLHNISQTVSDEYLNITADLLLQDNIYTMRYWLDKEYNGRVNATAEPFILPALLMALYYKQDLTVEGILSRDLFYGIRHFILPAWNKMGYFTPTLIAKHIQEGLPQIKRGIATGVSGGVDSFYSILNNITEEEKLDFLLQILHHDISFSEDMEESNRYVTQVSQELQIPVVRLHSNIMCHIKQAFECVHTYINISHALLLQPLIGTYIYSSGFHFNSSLLNFADSSLYDLLLAQAIKSSGFELVIYNPIQTRFDKIESISSNKITQQYLHVCFKNRLNSKNCTIYCEKCIRTILALDILNRIDFFNNVFDIPLFKKYRAYAWGESLYFSYIHHNVFHMELLAAAKNKHYTIPLRAYFFFIFKLLSKVMKTVTNLIFKSRRQ